MKYAVINTGNTTVYSTHEYKGSDWAGFKASYELANTGKTLVDLGASIFPDGQGWSQEIDGTYPSAPFSMADVLQNLIRQVSYTTDQIQFAGTFEYDGKLFPNDHEARDEIGILAAAVNASRSEEHTSELQSH